jgi:hypothetical protein
MSFIETTAEAIANYLEKAIAVFRDRDAEPVETLLIAGDGSLLPAHGILRDMGYHVGKKGLFPNERREILRRNFQSPARLPFRRGKRLHR